MHDLNFLTEHMELFKSCMARRHMSNELIDKLLELNKQRKELIFKTEEIRGRIKKISQDFGNLKKKKGSEEELASLKDEVSSQKDQLEQDQALLDQTQEQIDLNLQSVPNLLEDDVPHGQDDTANVEIARWGTPRKFTFEVLDHVTLGEKWGLLDFEAASKATGSRFVFYKGDLAKLERALIHFMLDQHTTVGGYTEVAPPFIVHEKSLFGTGQFPKFKEDVFKLEGRDWYLIPTAEVPLTNLKRESMFAESEFPIKYCAYSPCFRSEAGSYGKDTRGLIRQHQFSKVELVNIVAPGESQKAHQEMVARASSILELLGLPYRAIILCGGDTGFAMRKTIDLEVWLPGQDKYREISSISNAWDYQARRAQIRFRNEQGKPEFAHTLNGSGLAVGRTLVAILENYQREDGTVEVPKVLIPYMGKSVIGA